MARIVTQTYQKGNEVVVVLSAQGDTTDDLIAKASEINPRASKREMDMPVSYTHLEDKGVGIAAHITGDMLGLGDDRGDCGVKLQFAVADLPLRLLLLQPLCSVAHHVDTLALAGAHGGVAQVGDPRLNAERLGALGNLGADLNQLILIGINVDGAVTHGDHVAAAKCGRTGQNKARCV